MNKLRILTIVGARPQFIKAAAFSRAVAADAAIDEMILHSGQHFDANMSEIFFSELGIPAPRYNLDIHGGSHGAMTGRMLEGIEQILLESKPDAVLVYGDTNTTLAGALAAAKLKIRVLHVEAGLRSYNRAMPEEVNRVLTDHVSDLLLCPTRASVENLAKEGITRGVHHVGDVMFDATLHAKSMALHHSDILGQLNLKDGSFALCTIHRAENTDEPAQLAKVFDYVREIAADRTVVFPVHPRTRKLISGLAKTSSANLILIDPVGYLDMHRLLAGASMVFTDSGGLQKEAYFHRAPCVTIRTETEWVETIDAGWNRLWTVPTYAPRAEITDYGSGAASEQITAVIKSALSAGPATSKPRQ